MQNFEHLKFALLEVFSCLSEFCRKFAVSVEKVQLSFPPNSLIHVAVVFQCRRPVEVLL